MKHLKKFESYLITEAAGLANATLLYSDLIMDTLKNHMNEYLVMGIPKLEKSEKIEITDYNQIFSNKDWKQMPVKTIAIKYTFISKTDEEFKREFPKTSQTKSYTTTGACSSLSPEKDENSSYLEEPVDDRTENTIYLDLELGFIISEGFNDVEDLIIELESLVLHELNHAYENYRRMMNGAGQLSTDITWSLEANRSKIKKDIFKVWVRKIGYYIYWAEKHEINAMVQDSWPYVKRFDVDEMKMKAPSWKFSQDMIDFDATVFKKELIQVINQHYPDVNPNILLNRLKNGFANQLSQEREKSVLHFEDAPSLSGEKIRNMSFDKFLEFVQERVNGAGKKIQKRIIRLYSLKK